MKNRRISILLTVFTEFFVIMSSHHVQEYSRKMQELRADERADDVKKPTSAACGEWISYKDSDCIIFLDKAGTQTKQDGEKSCHSYAKNGGQQSEARLVTIRTKEKQNFIQELVFRKYEVHDNVWLGLEMGNDSMFRWNDGSEVDFFSNWIEQEGISKDRHHCAQMTSGEGVFKAGQWVKSNCKKRNAVVCEKRQTWSMTAMQNILYDLKAQVETNNQKMNKLIMNPVPLGLIYVQLPDQSPPSDMWPQVTWKDITSSYAGLFFRAAGGNASNFGKVQEENSPRLVNVERNQTGSVGRPQKVNTLPVNGEWSDSILSGDWDGKHDVYLRFQFSKGEVRPRNKAVIIWKRTA